MSTTLSRSLLLRGTELLASRDPVLHGLLEREQVRQAETLAMVAACSVADPSVLACEAMPTTNVTTEGYPGARFHAGCAVVDQIEELAIQRAKLAFGARFANVQPHSGSSANQIVLSTVLAPGDTILGLSLDCGGHLTHGSKASMSGQWFNAVPYGLDAQGYISYEQVAELAEQHRPRLIICGASAYPRTIDFRRFREIADRVGAYLLADISHIAGLVVAGVHPNPIDHAHFTTTSTYKQLFGPRGGLVLMGRDFDAPAPSGTGTLAQAIQRTVFPFFQGTPNLSAIAAKARALDAVATPEFAEMAGRIVSMAAALGRLFSERGYRVLTGGTDNHMVVIDVLKSGVTGVIAERSLERCNIVVNKNRIPGDQHPPLITSGMRLGTNTLAARGMTPDDMPLCFGLIDRVLRSVNVKGLREFDLSDDVADDVRGQVKDICRRYPLPDYPESSADTRPASRIDTAVAAGPR